MLGTFDDYYDDALRAAGHRPVALIGGGTARVGDPSGKTEMRQLLGAEQIESNKGGFRSQLGRFLNFDDDKSILVDNDDWLSDLNYIDFSSHHWSTFFGESDAFG